MRFDTSKLRVSTKTLMSLVAGAGALMQIPQINAIVTSFLVHYPRLGPAVGAVTTIMALWHNPEVRSALGIKETVEVVSLAPADVAAKSE